MGLMALFEKTLAGEVATAIPAIVATDKPITGLRIATIATIAVAETKKPEKAHLKIVPDTATILHRGRVSAFIAKGVPAEEADALASRLPERDRQFDDRKSCAECINYSRSVCRIGLYPFGSGRIEVLHRCNGFKVNQRTRLELEFGLFYNDP